MTAAPKLCLAIAAAVAACGSPRSSTSPTTTTHDGGGVVETTSAASSAPAANPPWCPPTPGANPCDKSRAFAQCTYADNRACRCEPPFSGGAPPDPNAPWVFRCAVATRADGCPGLPPVERSHCDAQGRSCSYPGVYANDFFVLSCQKGSWLMTKLPQPTP